MGRRKIEIQPITRKNGLFKKAYELGVLCSVDVAVIIFEERPGHHVKCYEYCSRDIRDIIDRHNHFDGERDTRTPADFGNNKAEEAGDDDDGDDDDDMGRSNGAKRRDGLRPKPDVKKNSGQLRPNDLSMSVDSDYRPMTIPAAPLSNLQLPSSVTNSSSLPISGERLNQPPPKKLRPNPGQLTPTGAPLSAHTPTFPPYDQDPAYRLNYPVHQNNLSSHAAQSFNASMFPGSPPPPSGNNLFDFPGTRRTTSYQDAYSAQPRLSQGHVHGQDALSFLGPGGGHRNSSSQGQNFGASFDWPIHQQAPQQQQQAQSAHHSPAQAAHNAHDTPWFDLLSSASAQASLPQPASTPVPSLHLPSFNHGGASHSHSSSSSNDSRRPSLSWERQQQHDVPSVPSSATPVNHPPGSAGSGGGGGGQGSPPNSTVVSPALSHKRARVDSSASGSVADVPPGSAGNGGDSVAAVDGVGEGDGDRGSSANGTGGIKTEGEGGNGTSIPAD
ncbi:hypothetical protein GLOTRDRAFT_133387 [Gloeophyllum trabeum ATCC 11539]|uniref:MADS-box domain-containing protein n=1 Tax=Gloeophyllum trabeum (strain ATCC 11539 / FP-39264 / Madison 617) TaxID=670483 RepID=S7RF07_GLOTA|nr:uncharacterized protein GLOTRDRAFT_133387 [Gloeophyllum trabeum ATCC 11539]EPQ51059.1 hypothetical protein GLOTRDRAFT_133387 [Gloeophyllum trabeum ATCC 11539]